MHAGRLRTYFDSPKLAVDCGVGRNTAIVEDTVSNQMIIIASGMFPFSTMHDPQITELIDYVFPAQAANAKNLNIILSNLSQIQARLNANPVDEVKRWAQSVLEIIVAVPAVLEGTGIDIGEQSDFMQKLRDMVANGKKKGLAAYLTLIKAKLLGHYNDYVDCLTGYFQVLHDNALLDGASVEFAKTAIIRLNEVKEIIHSINAAQFSRAVSELQSVAKFQENAHKLVHSEDILLYCVVMGRIGLRGDGIRFFTKYDMCEMCEDIVWRYAHKGNVQFIVLSREEYIDSIDRNADKESILLKKRI